MANLQVRFLCGLCHIFIEIYRGNEDIINIVKNIGQENIAISDVSCAELLFGARSKNELNAISNDLKKITRISIDSDVSVFAVELVEKHSLSHKLKLPDALIKATAIVYNFELYTLNFKDFKFLEHIKLFTLER